VVEIDSTLSLSTGLLTYEMSTAFLAQNNRELVAEEI